MCQKLLIGKKIISQIIEMSKLETLFITFWQRTFYKAYILNIEEKIKKKKNWKNMVIFTLLQWKLIRTLMMAQKQEKCSSKKITNVLDLFLNCLFFSKNAHKKNVLLEWKRKFSKFTLHKWRYVYVFSM